MKIKQAKTQKANFCDKEYPRYSLGIIYNHKGNC